MKLDEIQGDIAIIGTGQMGGAILSGLLAAGFPAARVRAGEPNQAHVDRLNEQLGIRATTDNRAAVSGAAVVILAVKPHLVAGILGNIASALAKDALVISIAAGISLDALREAARDRADVIRVMPNTPARVGAGMAGVVPGPGVTDQQTDIALAIMSSVGQAVVVDEKQLDILGTVSGSGPAYLFLVAEAMIEGAVRLGLTRDLATKLVTQTLVGSAKLLAETGEHPAILREQVTSPGGTTAAALYELESAGIRAAFSAALEANLRRTHELG